MRLPANHDEIAGEVGKQELVLDLRVLCGTSRAEAHVPVRRRMKRVPFELVSRGTGMANKVDGQRASKRNSRERHKNESPPHPAASDYMAL